MTQSVAMINKKSRRQAMIWLIMAGVMLILWFLMSLSHATPEIAKERQKTKAVAEDFALPVTIDNLNELSKEVPPIDFATVVRDLRNYPVEFKGKKFLKTMTNAGRCKSWMWHKMRLSPNISKDAETVISLLIFAIIMPITNSVIS
ncbi:hypothetical protein [Moraxella bovis]|uniref:hypothetical protein n=1 Tax=Moraxella bovis TaxID=476 RepID=UPI002226FF07|nr:hypothetical protein [Moraxella bovis]UZA13669.1 hypothetical protein LP102_09655 [Moraxella bovis]